MTEKDRRVEARVLCRLPRRINVGHAHPLLEAPAGRKLLRVEEALTQRNKVWRVATQRASLGGRSEGEPLPVSDGNPPTRERVLRNLSGPGSRPHLRPRGLQCSKLSVEGGAVLAALSPKQEQSQPQREQRERQGGA